MISFQDNNTRMMGISFHLIQHSLLPIPTLTTDKYKMGIQNRQKIGRASSVLDIESRIDRLPIFCRFWIGYKFPLNYYSSEEYDEKCSSLLPIPTLTTDKYKMGWQTNDGVEGNVEFNSVATSDDSIITNKYYSPPSLLLHSCFN